MTRVLTVLASEHNFGTTCLMLEDVLVQAHLLATPVVVYALELYFSEQVSRYSVHLVKLTVATTERTVVGVLVKPMALTLSAYRFLAHLTLKRVFEYVIADSAYEFWQERSYVAFVVDVIFFVNIGASFFAVSTTATVGVRFNHEHHHLLL